MAKAVAGDLSPLERRVAPARPLAKESPMSETAAPSPAKPEFELRASRLFSAWLAEQNAALAFTTYQAGKLFLIGTHADGRLSVFERTFPRSMGLGVAADGQSFQMSALYQLWRFQNFLDAGETHQGYDAVFVPVVG
ncbi:MAG: DUF4915 domain-containing protein, partial [Pseudomonadota bacterium]